MMEKELGEEDRRSALLPRAAKRDAILGLRLRMSRWMAHDSSEEHTAGPYCAQLAGSNSGPTLEEEGALRAEALDFRSGWPPLLLSHVHHGAVVLTVLPT